jgi:hypothetical protein
VHQWAQRILEDVRLMGEAVSQEKRCRRADPHLQQQRLWPQQAGGGIVGTGRAAALLEIQLELLDRAVDLVEEGFQLDIRVGRCARAMSLPAALPATGAFCAPHPPMWLRMACRSRCRTAGISAS